MRNRQPMTSAACRKKPSAKAEAKGDDKGRRPLIPLSVEKTSRRTGPRRRAQSEKASTAPARLMAVAPTRPGREAIPSDRAPAAGTERKSVHCADTAYGRRANATRSGSYPVELGLGCGHRAKKRPLRRHGLWPSRQRDWIGGF